MKHGPGHRGCMPCLHNKNVTQGESRFNPSRVNPRRILTSISVLSFALALQKNSTKILHGISLPGFTLGNFSCSVDRGIDIVQSVHKLTS